MSDYKEIKREYKEERKRDRQERKLDRKINKLEDKLNKLDGEYGRKRYHKHEKCDLKDNSSSYDEPPKGYSTFFDSVDSNVNTDHFFSSEHERPANLITVSETTDTDQLDEHHVRPANLVTVSEPSNTD